MCTNSGCAGLLSGEFRGEHRQDGGQAGIGSGVGWQVHDWGQERQGRVSAVVLVGVAAAEQVGTWSGAGQVEPAAGARAFGGLLGDQFRVGPRRGVG
jgi:hypothetical protein